MKKTIFLLFLFLLSINCIGQNNQDELKFLILSSKYSEALDACNSLISNNPDNPELYYYQALINKLSFRYPDADKSIKNALILDNANNNYLFEYGLILLKRDKEKEAQNVFEIIIDKNPYHISSGISLSNIYLKQKKYEKANEILLNLYSKDTTNGYFARNLGLCSIKLKNSKNAIKWLKRAIELDSTDIKAYEYISLVYTSKKEFDLALEKLNSAVKFDPGNKELYAKIGDIHVTRNHNFQAVPAYLKAFEIDPKDELLAKNLGISYYKIKKYDKAKNFLEIAMNSGMMDLQVFQYLGDVHTKLNQQDSSIFYYDLVLELLKPDYNSIFSILINKAESYYALNEYYKAIESYKLASEIEIDTYWVTYRKNEVFINIAAIYQDKLNEKELAIEYYQKVTEPEISINKNYYVYAQQQITMLKEELFFEGKPQKN